MKSNHDHQLKFNFDSKLLVHGDVMHKRLKTKINSFIYKVFSISDIEIISRGLLENVSIKYRYSQEIQI